jgi:hypothetical protein
LAVRRLLTLGMTLLLALGLGVAAQTTRAAAPPACVVATTVTGSTTTTTSAAMAPAPGHPCWTDFTTPSSGAAAYPFGTDGNPKACPRQDQLLPGFPCQQVSSMAFRAWNRGLAATSPLGVAGNNPFGVWLFNGLTWFPDPTFPGSAECPGSTVLWAGKLDYWLIGPKFNLFGFPETPQTANAGQTLCRYDGVNLVWEPLKLPQGTLARLPLDPTSGNPDGGITAGACYAWNNCWFFGTDGISAHWDGQSLSDESPAPAPSPWLQGDFTGAVARTDASGASFGLAVAKSTSYSPTAAQPPAVPAQPDGTPPPQAFGSQGGAFTPLPPAPAPQIPPATDLLAVDSDAKGDAWTAGDPNVLTPNNAAAQPAPLLRVGVSGAPAACAGYGPGTFTASSTAGYDWTSLSVFSADASALAGVYYRPAGATTRQPAIVQATCGQAPSTTTFPDPTTPTNQADPSAETSAVAANAANDAWAAATPGNFAADTGGGVVEGFYTPPHLYRWTDGQTPAAPAGDDNETRPSLFTLDAPVYVQPPAVVITPTTVTTSTTTSPTQQVNLPPALYGVHSKLRQRSCSTKRSPKPCVKFTLYISFKLRRPITVGVEGLRGKKIVARSGMKRFTGPTGTLALSLNRAHWPTKIAFVMPPGSGG